MLLVGMVHALVVVSEHVVVVQLVLLVDVLVHEVVIINVIAMMASMTANGTAATRRKFLIAKCLLFGID